MEILLGMLFFDIFLNMKYILGSNQELLLKDEDEQCRGEKRKLQDSSDEDIGKGIFDSYIFSEFGFDEDFEEALENIELQDFSLCSEYAADSSNISTLESYNKNVHINDTMQEHSKDNKKEEIINFLTQLLNVEQENFKFRMKLFIELIKHDTLIHPMTFLKNLILHANRERHMTLCKNEDSRKEYEDYLGCFRNLVLFTCDVTMENRYFLSHVYEAERQVNLKDVVNIYSSTFLKTIKEDFDKFSEYIALEIRGILVKLNEKYKFFSTQIETSKNKSTEIILEIIDWLKKCSLCYYFMSEINLIESNFRFLGKQKEGSLATQLCCLYYFTLRAIIGNNILPEAKISPDKYIEQLENDKFWGDLLFLKCLIIEILGYHFAARIHLLSYCKVTNFFIFSRMLFRNNLKVIKKYDLWLINENFSHEKLFQFKEEAYNIIASNNFDGYDERQKKILIVSFVEEMLFKKTKTRYRKIIRAIENLEGRR
ncbi:hypothetical protein H312_01994 [Anncaliia algerae PRA339]|uniref:Uncharacterized protein n=1 Tax=Anncaliia algerae PRA339 TaxID=1288291 RepID=A0A059F0W2_9MICR|nr:hypothetical protein H312_01994 [Anncaliia algerae PRA339]